MINPIVEFYDYILGVFQALPQPLSALILLGAGVGIISAIVNIVFR